MNRPALTSDPNTDRDVSTIPGSVSWRVGGVKSTASADLLAFLPALTFDHFARLGNGQPANLDGYRVPNLPEWKELRGINKPKFVLQVKDPDLIWQWLQQHHWRWVSSRPLFVITYRWGHLPTVEEWARGGLTLEDGQTRALADMMSGGNSGGWHNFLPQGNPESRPPIIMSYAAAWQDQIFSLVRDGLNVGKRHDLAAVGSSVGDMFDYVPDQRGAPFMGFERALAYLRADVRPEEAARFESGNPVDRPTDSALQALAALR